jgi:hypothetical protein
MKENDHKSGIIKAKIEVLPSKFKEHTVDELLQMADIYVKSNLAPTHFKTKEALFIAFQWAIALGINPFLGIKDIYVIDNIPNIKTEAAIALVESSGFCENMEQFFEGNEYNDDFTAVCVVKRVGRKPHISRFSVKDAKLAKLWGKKTKNGADTSWIEYPKVMLMYRAVGFALRMVFPDVLRGATLREEIAQYREYETIESKVGDNGLDIKIVKNNNNNYNRPSNKTAFNDLPPEDMED